MKSMRIGYLDGEPFITRCEEALAEGDTVFLDGVMPRLENLIARLQERAYELAELQHRAGTVRERHDMTLSRRSAIRFFVQAARRGSLRPLYVACMSTVVLFIVAAMTAPAVGAPADAACKVKPLTDEQAEAYGLDTTFYKKCTPVQGILIATSDQVSD